MIRRAVLKLNASYEPLAIISARNALKIVTTGKAVVVVPTSIQIHPGIYLPSVVRLQFLPAKYIPVRLQVVSRKNIFIRDGHRCMYCGRRFQSADLTLDHILPRSRGGKGSWDNLVSACRGDNHRKGDRTPEEAGMKLIHRPLPQTIHTRTHILRSLGSEIEEWSPYLWHDSAGDRRYAFN